MLMRKKKLTEVKKKARHDTSHKAKKVYKRKKAVKKQLVPRTRNMGTMTEVEFFGKIRSALRRAFRFWKPMSAALDMASRPSESSNPRLKKEYQCAKCKEWFARKDVEIDHIEECGSLMSFSDIPTFVKNLTREDVGAYQVLCKKDHKEKTQAYLKERRKQK